MSRTLSVLLRRLPPTFPHANDRNDWFYKQLEDLNKLPLSQEQLLQSALNALGLFDRLAIRGHRAFLTFDNISVAELNKCTSS